MDELELSIIIPCFNEEQNVKKFYDKVKTIMGGGSLKFQNIYFIFIDDGSTDNTETEILNLKQSNSNIKYIKFSRNFGKESAMLAGLKASKTILTCIMDCDLQDPPELLLEMIDKYKRSNGDLKMITAKRKNRSGDSKIRAIFSEGFYKINNLISPIKLESGIRDFRLIHRDALDSILDINEYHRFSKAIFEFVGFKKEVIEYDYIDRESGSSKWNFLKLFIYAIEGIVSFSTVPLKIITLIGFTIFALSSLYGIYMIIDTILFGNDVKGYPSIVTLISFFGGLQIILLGIIGEYIARIYEQSKNRPHYFIEYEK